MRFRALLLRSALVGVVATSGWAATAAPAGDPAAGDQARILRTGLPPAFHGRPHVGSTPADPERGRSGTSAWRLSRPALAGQIEGYLTRTDAPSGDVVPLRVSTTAARFRVQAYRFGWYSGGQARQVWQSGWVQGRHQPGPSFASTSLRTVEAPWQDSLAVSTAGWPAGAYVLKLTASSGWQSYVPYVVRSTAVAGRVALVAPVATWQAYNTWGGDSLYVDAHGGRRSWQVSFDRPYADPGAADMLYGVRPVVVRAERLGVPLAYLTDLDVDASPGVLAGARAYVSLGHAEYWTPGMREAVLAARAAGTNLAFFGANTEYWRVRLTSTGTGPRRAVLSYKVDAGLDPVRDSPLTTARFRDPPDAVPEEALTGVQYECYPVDATYRVASPRWWGFAGTGVHTGTSFAHLVGIEADRAYPVPTTPRPLEVLSHSPFLCGGVATSSESVYLTVSSGAGEFTAGTLRWTCALFRRCGPVSVSAAAERFVRRVTDNLLLAFAAGPAGRRFPAHDNLGRFSLPSVNRVPAS